MQWTGIVVPFAVEVRRTVGGAPFVLASLALFIIVARFALRIPWIIICAAAVLPYAAFMLDHPFSTSLRALEPSVVLAAGWAALLVCFGAAAIVYRLLAVVNPFGAKGAPLAAFAAVCCVALLAAHAYRPELVSLWLPGWGRTIGIACMATAGLSALAACIRCAKAVVPLLFWGALVFGIGRHVVDQNDAKTLYRMAEQQAAAIWPDRRS